MGSNEYTPILPTAAVAPRRPLPLAVAWAAVAATALLAASAVLFPSSFRSDVVAIPAGAVPQAADAVLTLSKRETPYPPGPNGERDLLPFCEERFILQPLDHFKGEAVGDGETFAMRYFVCAPENFAPEDEGAIFFYVGNEADVTLYLNHTGLMWENARDFGALIVFAEHRYFGKSVPFGLDVLDHLEFLSTQQALADYAVLVEQLKAEIHADVPVIGFGGSYGGMLGTWFRLKYPHIIDGVIAGSAPVLAFLGDNEGSFNSEGFNRVITYDMSEEAGSAPNCIDNTRAAISAVRELGNSTEGRQHLAELFRLCDEDALKTEEDVEALIAAVLDVFGNLAMGNYPYPSSYIMEGLSDLPAYPVRAACEYLAPDFADDNDGLISGLRDAAGVFYNNTKDLQCYFPSDDADDATQNAEELSEDDKKRAAIAAKGNFWGYLECSELYMPFSTDGVHDVFPPQPANMTLDDANCVEQWGVHLKPYWAQTEYGGVKGLRTSSNIVFSNGDFDPWSATGVRESLSDSVVAVRVPGGAHHLDLMFSHPLDTREVRRARETELKYVRKWIDEFYAEKKHRQREARKEEREEERKEREKERKEQDKERKKLREEREGELKQHETESEKQERKEHERERKEHERERKEHERERKEHDRERKEHEKERKEHEAEDEGEREGREAEREAERKEREAERKEHEAEDEGEREGREAEREAERKEREAEREGREAEQEGEREGREAEREGREAEREAEREGREAGREGERAGREAEREGREAEREGREAEREGERAGREAEREAEREEREAEREEHHRHHRGEEEP